MWRGPHVVRPGSVVALGTERRVFAEASLVQRDRRACLGSWRGTAPWWRSSRAVQTCSGLRLRRDTVLVTTVRVLAASCDLFSHLVEDGGVLCRVRLFMFWGLFVWWCVLRPIM
jgi:hypothetical protein